MYIINIFNIFYPPYLFILIIIIIFARIEYTKNNNNSKTNNIYLLMKRLSLLFSLLLLCVVAAMAQRIASIGDEVTDGNFNPHEHYIMKLVSYNNGTSDVNVEDQNLYFYTTEGARLKAATITLDDVSSNNYLLNMYSTSIEGVYTLGMGTTFVASFTSGSGGFNCSKNNKNFGGKLNAYKLHKQETGGYILQGYRGSDAGLYLKYNKSSEQTEVIGSGSTSAMVVKIYKANTPFKEGKFYTLTLREGAEGNRNVVLQNILYASTRSAKTTNTNGIWFFKKNVDAPSQWYIYNVYAGENYPAHATTNNNSNVTFDGERTSFSVGKGDNRTNGFSFIVSGNAALNDVNGCLGVWNNPGACNTDGSTFIAKEVSETYANCTYTFTDATNNRSVVRKTMGKVGEVPSVPTLYYFTATTTSFSNAVTADGENNYTIEGTFKYPFTITTSDGAATWYAMKVRINTPQRDVVVNDQYVDSRVYFNNAATNYSRFNDGLFCFVSDGSSEYFKIKNRNGKYLKSGGTNNESDLQTTSNESEALSFEIRKNDYTGAADTDFSLLPRLATSTSYVYGDHHGDTGHICLWTSGKTQDDGSRFRIQDANTTTDILNIGRNAEANTLATAAPSTHIGGYTTAAIDAFKAATYTSLSDIETKAAALGNNESNLQTANESKYYRIQANRYTTPVYMSFNNATADKDGAVQTGSSSSDNVLLLGFSQTASASNLVQFENNGEGKYYIKDVNSGLYYGKCINETNKKVYLVKDKNNAGNYSVAYSLNGNVGQVGLKENTETNIRLQYLFCCGDNADDAIGGNNYAQFHSPYYNDAETGSASTSEPGCVYQIAEVNTYPLTISDALYASLCLPFSVTLPEGLKAYKVSSVTNGTEHREMDLTAIEGAIAANEPIIIGATTAGSYELTINAENTEAKSEDNWLTGATVKRTGIDEDYFALGYKALSTNETTTEPTKTVGFFRVTTQNMPANKAYLLKSRIQESAANPAMMFTFNFDNVTTNINNTKANETESSNTYYDLNGRRVLYPTHGIYVKGNGQKVFIQ